MRHDRSSDFEGALADVDAIATARRWHEVASDPNDPRALVHRTLTLRRAWRPAVERRIEFFEDRCAGKSVLDVGCVAHDIGRMSSPRWLHGRLATVAARCIGVDIVPEGIEAMRAAGYDVVLHDLSAGLGPLSERVPFDVIVAGELFEHLGSIDMLFSLAAAALSDDGELIITTPNPFNPARVRAGQRGLVHENVDHVSYAFPSAIAELCERHGLRLSEAMTSAPARRRVRGAIKAAYRRARGTRWANIGLTTGQHIRQAELHVGSRAALRSRFAPRDRRFLGETFYYVVRR